MLLHKRKLVRRHPFCIFQAGRAARPRRSAQEDFSSPYTPPPDCSEGTSFFAAWRGQFHEGDALHLGHVVVKGLGRCFAHHQLRIGVALEQRGGELRAHVAADGAAHRVALPGLGQPDVHLFGGEQLRHAEGDGLLGHALHRAARAGERGGNAGQRRELHDAGGAGGEALCREGVAGPVEREAPIQPDAAECHVRAAQLPQEAGRRLRVARVRKDALFSGQGQLRVQPLADLPLHKAAQGQRMVGRDPLLPLVQILAHIDEPAVLQADVPLVDQLHEVPVLPGRARLAEKHRAPAQRVVALDLAGHGDRHRVEYVVVPLQDHKRDARMLLQFPDRIIQILLHRSSSFLLCSVFGAAINQNESERRFSTQRMEKECRRCHRHSFILQLDTVSV